MHLIRLEAQEKFYTIDSIKSKTSVQVIEIIQPLDTSLIELHTWYYYNPGQVISSLDIISTNKTQKEQRLYDVIRKPGYPVQLKCKVELVYKSDTVFVTQYFPNARHSYFTKKMNRYEIWPVKYNLRAESYDVNYSLVEGISIDSSFWENGQIVFTSYYPNGQLRRHEYVENGKVRIEDYYEDGKKMKLTGLKSIPHILPIDSVDVEFYTLDSGLRKFRVLEYDTSNIKVLTWQHYEANQIIVDSTYIKNGIYIKEQKLYEHTGANRNLKESFRYEEDTVSRTSFLKNNTFSVQYVKQADSDPIYKWFMMLSDVRFSHEFQEFGWGIVIHEDGYVLDSIYYENGKAQIIKEFYPDGQIKLHARRGGPMIEYKKNGQIKKQRDHSDLIKIMALIFAQLAASQ